MMAAKHRGFVNPTLNETTALITCNATPPDLFSSHINIINVYIIYYIIYNLRFHWGCAIKRSEEDELRSLCGS